VFGPTESDEVRLNPSSLSRRCPVYGPSVAVSLFPFSLASTARSARSAVASLGSPHLVPRRHRCARPLGPAPRSGQRTRSDPASPLVCVS